MKIRFKSFGMVAEQLQNRIAEIVLPDIDGPIDLHKMIERKFPVLRQMPYRIALNQELVNGPCKVPPGAELVLLPPFAGG